MAASLVRRSLVVAVAIVGLAGSVGQAPAEGATGPMFTNSFKITCCVAGGTHFSASADDGRYISGAVSVR